MNPEQNTNQPDTPNSDDLLAELLQEHASPEQQDAALEAVVQREEQALRDALHPQHEQQQQPEQGNRYQSQPEQQQMQQESIPASPAAVADAAVADAASVTARDARAKLHPVRCHTPFGVNANIQLPDLTLLRIPVGYDDPIWQWLAAKRQGLEQEATHLRYLVGQFAQAAYYTRDDADVIERDGAQGEPDRPYRMVTPDFYTFGRVAAELYHVEGQLRTLGVEPQRCGLTREAWEMFQADVIEAQDEEAMSDEVMAGEDV